MDYNTARLLCITLQQDRHRYITDYPEMHKETDMNLYYYILSLSISV